MKTTHFVTNFVSPTLLYMSIVLYFICGLSIVASLGRDSGFLILGLVAFILAYNSWHFGKKAQDEK